jgi:uncharacterized membrane protein
LNKHTNPTLRGDASVQAVSGWILRLGVIASVVVIISGGILSFSRHHVPMERMTRARFEFSPDEIWRGLCDLRGQAVIELGILLLLATPIARVAASAVIFLLAERDWVYTVITAIVLVMTLAGLMLGR